MTIELLLCNIMFPSYVSFIDLFSHMAEYSFAGFHAGICSGFLYALKTL